MKDIHFTTKELIILIIAIFVVGALCFIKTGPDAKSSATKKIAVLTTQQTNTAVAHQKILIGSDSSSSATNKNLAS